jgi:hypothetical protein
MTPKRGTNGEGLDDSPGCLDPRQKLEGSMKRVSRRPSPAMVVAIVALIAALGGTAIAGGVLNKKKVKNISNNQITQRASGLSVSSAKSADSANNSNALGGLPLRGLSMWALMNSSGTGGVVSSSGGVTATTLGVGRVRVTFPNPVTNCAINANGGTSANASNGTDFSPGFVMVARSTTGANDVQYEVDEGAAAGGTAVATEPVFMTVQC